MKIYQLLKLFTSIRSPRVRLIGLWLMNRMGRRYVGVFLDPVIACNLRCRMCYFSGSKGREMSKERMSLEHIDKISKSVFDKALKLQIGCGGEPSLYNNLLYIVEKAKEYRVPYISLTTNGNLLKKEDLRKLVIAGLNEITISVHGVQSETYEYFMQNANYGRFLALLKFLEELKKDYPNFKIRINYTINEDNLVDLKFFWTVFGGLKFDVLQLRPIQNIGDCMYENYNLDKLKKDFYIISNLVEECRKRGITTLAPTMENLERVDDIEYEGNSLFEKITHCYVYPNGCNDGDFDYENETINQYHKRVGVWREVIQFIFLLRSNKKILRNTSLKCLIIGKKSA